MFGILSTLLCNFAYYAYVQDYEMGTHHSEVLNLGKKLLGEDLL